MGRLYKIYYNFYMYPVNKVHKVFNPTNENENNKNELPISYNYQYATKARGHSGNIIVTAKISSYLTSLNYYYYFARRVTQHLYFIVACRLPTTFAIYAYPYPPLKRVQSFSSICFCFFSLLFYPLLCHGVPMWLCPFTHHCQNHRPVTLKHPHRAIPVPPPHRSEDYSTLVKRRGPFNVIGIHAGSFIVALKRRVFALSGLIYCTYVASVG